MFKLTADKITPLDKVARTIVHRGLTGQEGDACKKIVSLKDSRYRLNIYRGHSQERALGLELKPLQKSALPIKWLSLEQIKDLLSYHGYAYTHKLQSLIPTEG